MLLHSLLTTILWKGMNPIIPTNFGLNTITTILLHEWLFHLITHKNWYAIKQRNQPTSHSAIQLFGDWHKIYLSESYLSSSKMAILQTIIYLAYRCNFVIGIYLSFFLSYDWISIHFISLLADVPDIAQGK